MDVSSNLRNSFASSMLLDLYRGLVRPCIKYSSYINTQVVVPLTQLFKRSDLGLFVLSSLLVMLTISNLFPLIELLIPFSQLASKTDTALMNSQVAHLFWSITRREKKKRYFKMMEPDSKLESSKIITGSVALLIIFVCLCYNSMTFDNMSKSKQELTPVQNYLPE